MKKEIQIDEEITIADLTRIVIKSFEEVTRNFTRLENKIDTLEINLGDRIDAVGQRIDRLTLDKADRSEHTNLVKKLTLKNVL